MLAKVFSGATNGVDGILIEVEVDVASRGFPTFMIVGLPSKGIDEAKDRVRTAIINTSYEMPDSRITVNLAPADIPKSGTSFDLPIAVGILAASGMIEKSALVRSMFIGELSLEGQVRKVPGVIPMVLMAQKHGIENIFIPLENAPEALLVDDVTVYAVPTLTDLILHLNGQTLLMPSLQSGDDTDSSYANESVDFKHIKGQAQARRALEIAAAGFHNVHFTGPPGTGKTLLCKAFTSLLPPLSKSEILEVSRIYSVAGLLQNTYFMKHRPFRAPHHTISRAGLIGGGSNLTPGEISLAHRGVLFLDEFPEFPRSVLESLRQPIEDGIVTISRARGAITFPARFLFLAASNPCPCGYLGHPKKSCHCMPGQISKYQRRISGPLLDRIDLHVSVPVVESESLVSTKVSESSESIRKRIMIGRKRQEGRFKRNNFLSNGEVPSSVVQQFFTLADDAREFLMTAVSRLSLSARSYYKIIKVSQTIADLDEQEVIQRHHIAEALQFRSMI